MNNCVFGYIHSGVGARVPVLTVLKEKTQTQNWNLLIRFERFLILHLNGSKFCCDLKCSCCNVDCTGKTKCRLISK